MSIQSNSEWLLPEKTSEDFLQYILESREITDYDKFLLPNIDDIPDSSKLYNSKKAAKTIIDSINNNEHIVICGDFDADGICASALIWDFLYNDLSKFLNKKINILPYIPDRVEQGYGLTESSLNDIVELDADLLITVDCGVRDNKLIKHYQEKGLKFVITDHHQPPSDLPKKLTYPLVHQMYPNHEYPTREICGTTVAFLLIQEIKKQIGMDYKITKDTKGLDLVAIATITDIMPLIDANRIFVKYGLEQIAQKKRLGLEELCIQAKLDSKSINAYHLGYVLGPRINATGRIGKPLDGVRLLVSKNKEQCREIASQLEQLNTERKELTEEIREQAEEQITNKDNKLIFILGNNWHEGVIGLVAGKLLEKYHLPVLVATNNNDSIRGSARSISGFNITKTLEKFSKYLKRYGGHELAAGFTAKTDTIQELIKEITEYANNQITDEQLIKKTKVDLVLETYDITYDFINKLKILEPFGYGNSKPIISLLNLVIVKKQILGKEQNHMKLAVKGNGVELLTLTLFGCNEDTDTIKEKQQIDVIGYPEINIWNGRESIQFNVREWRFSS